MLFYTIKMFLFFAQVVFATGNCTSQTATKFENNCYELFTTSKSWNASKEYCSNFTGTRILAKVTSLAVLTFLKTKFKPDVTSETRVWLGGNDVVQEGEWVWTDYTKANLTSMWKQYEPNNQGDEDCLDIFEWDKLNDEKCSLLHPFICMEIHENSTTYETDKTTSVTSKGPTSTTETISTNIERNVPQTRNVSGYTLEKSTTFETDKTTSVTSECPTSTTETTSTNTERNVPQTRNVSGYTLETTTKSITDTTTDLSSIASMEAIVFTTERNVSNEKMAPGLAEGIGIGTGICVVVTLSLLAVVLAIKFCCKKKSLGGNLEQNGNSMDGENQTQQGNVSVITTLTETEQDELDGSEYVYADCSDYPEQTAVYDNMTQTEAGTVEIVELNESEHDYLHLYADFIDQQGVCY